MKIAFPISACAALDYYTAAMLAKQHGFDGVELNVVQDASKTREIFAGSRIEIAALNSGCDLNALPQQIKVAFDLGCRSIRIKGDGLFSRSGIVTPDAIKRLIRVGDLAANASVCILIENQPIHESAIKLWRLLDRLNHPAIACTWNTGAAVIAGDNPSIAVPTLNSRIRYVHSAIDDANVPARKRWTACAESALQVFYLSNCPALRPRA